MPDGTTVDLFRAEADTAIQFNRGDPVEIGAANGFVSPINAAADSMFGVSAETVLTAAANQEVLIYPARPGMIWEGRASGTPTQAQIGDQVDFSVFTSGAMTIDTSSNVNGQLTFVGKREFTDAFAAAMDILVTINAAFNTFEGS